MYRYVAKKSAACIALFLMLSASCAIAQESSPEKSGADPDISDYSQFVSYPHLEKGLNAYARGDYVTAVKELEQAQRLAPKSRRIALQYALALEANRQLTDALAIIQPWIDEGNATVEMQSAHRQMWLTLNKSNLGKLRAASSEADFKNIQSRIDKRFDSMYDESVYVEALAKSPFVSDGDLIGYTPKFTDNQVALIMSRLETKNTPDSLNDYLRQITPLINANPGLLDRVTFFLSTHQNTLPAASLLMQAYPFENYPTSTRTNLLGRLSVIALKQPELFSSRYTQQLCQPLDEQRERSQQIELLKNLNACGCLRQQFMPYQASLNARDWMNISQCYGQQPGLAEYSAEQSLTSKPKADPLKLLAYSAYKSEDYSTALDAWKRVPDDQFTPTDRLAAQTTAIVAGDIDFAKQQSVAYQTSHAPLTDRYYWNLALIDIHDQQWASAAEQLNAAINLKPDPTYYEKLGLVEDKLAHQTASLQAYETAAQLAPTDTQIQFNLGFAAYRSGDYTQANDAFNAARKGRPDDIALTEQIAYTNQKLGVNDQAIYFSKLAVDDYQRRSADELSDRDINTEYGLRRMNEDLARRWSFNVDGAASNNATPLTGSPQPGLSYRNFWQAEAAYRLGDMGIDNGKTYSAYSRIFSGNGMNSTDLPLNAPMLGVGLRWKPFSEQIINLAAEEQIPLDHVQQTRSDTLVRASGSFFNSGRFSDEWRPTGSGWLAQNLYLDAAYYLGASTSTLTADYRTSYHFKLPNAETLEPYAHLQWNTMNTVTGDDFRIGLGMRWNLWRSEDKYNAYSSRYFFGIEAQHAFTTYLNAKNAILAILGVRL